MMRVTFLMRNQPFSSFSRAMAVVMLAKRSK